jgi:DNA-binding NarL/FixJ family response regulator
MVVSGQRTFADALAVRLRAEPDMTVIAVAQSTEAARRVLIGRQVDVLLLDRELPGDASLRLCAEASAAESGPRVLILSEQAEPSRIAAAVRAGVAGWAGKEESIDHLLQVIRRVAKGETWLPPAQLGGVLRLLMQGHDDPTDEANLLAALTPRERDVLFLLIRGVGRKEVADQLHVSANTVRTHLRSLMTKLGAHSTLEVVAKTRSTLNFPPVSGDDSAPPH